jgi:putative drug exporter of the RND superfamily
MSVTERLARVCARRRWPTVVAWLVAMVVAAAAVALALGSLTTNGHPTNDPESQRAAAAIDRAFPPDPRHALTDLVVVRSAQHTVDSSVFRSFVEQLVAAGRATGSVANAQVYYRVHRADEVSADRHALLIPILIPNSDEAGAVERVVAHADGDPAFAVSITGSQTKDYDVNKLSQHDLKSGELRFGIPAALVVLLLVFGTAVAGLVPLLMAIVSIVVALGLVALFSQAFHLSVFIVNMLTGMGLALGIDYSLFVVSRYREERAVGRDEAGAIAGAGATASRSVLVSGTAFVVAMCGMLIVPNNVMRSLALGAILVGIVSVVGALTLLPALLGLLGDRVNAWRIPLVGRASLEASNPEGRFWRAIVSRVLRRPWLSLLLAVAVFVAAAIPVLGLRVGSNGVSTLPDRFAARHGFAALQRDFPHATTNPVRVVVDGDASSPDAQRGLRRLQATLARDPRFEGGGAIVRSPNGTVAQLVTPVRGDPDGRRAIAAVRDLRRHLIPAAFAGSAAAVLVGGDTAETADYLRSVSSPAPYVFLLVLGLTFVLLTIVFRSVVVAATAVLLNLLSVGAAYGLLVLVFEHGVGAGLLGFQHADTIEAWVPLFLFSVLFGLSMDYQVFLLSRIRERYDTSRDTADAVTHGVAATARIITGAALIIVAVFLGFAMGDLIMFQQMGFGIAVALLLDATLIRSVVLPSAMKLLGERNWYLPGWLAWLPRLDVEEAPASAPGLSPR